MGGQQRDSTDVLDEFDLRQIRLQWLVVRIVLAPVSLALLAFVIVANIRGPEAAVYNVAARDPDLPPHLVRYVLYVASVVVLTVAYVIRRAAANPQSRVHRFTGSYLNGVVIAGALCGSVGMYGLVDFLLEGDYLWFYLFVGISSLALVLLRPRKQDLIDLATQSKRDL
jgi:hypothetical protein